MADNGNMASESEPRDPFVSRKAALLATAVAVASVVIPFWFWMDTWFGKPLSDEQIAEYLSDSERPRRAQHAIAQISAPDHGRRRIRQDLVSTALGTRPARTARDPLDCGVADGRRPVERKSSTARWSG